MSSVNSLFPKAVAISLVIASCGVTADESWLPGIWEFDHEKTLAELESTEGAPEHLVACYRDGPCGRNVKFRLTQETRENLWSNGNVAGPYAMEVVYSHQQGPLFVMEVYEVDDNSIDRFYFLDADHVYGFATFGGFVWKEYLKRASQ
ncbi:hypothetical protein E4634_19845 [Mangrovimicrobium sediminis]|uniref:Lipoprotein n=1 Tax=Mangrovimicrobium sediminis TaxID=2562682 RepID=A0A4Z0LUZ8_9GAMM|nr:hypothetical protein [Haliea sp. SAOS-164]TGD71099.1 hypothetical protein E4634_19845 [Haliea sp. SAOS-164]